MSINAHFPVDLRRYGRRLYERESFVTNPFSKDEVEQLKERVQMEHYEEQ